MTALKTPCFYFQQNVPKHSKATLKNSYIPDNGPKHSIDTFKIKGGLRERGNECASAVQ